MIKVSNQQIYLLSSSDDQQIAVERQLGPDMVLSHEEAQEVFHFFKENHNLFQAGSELQLEFPFEPLEGDKVVLFPGSFSPWHEGHEACVRNLPAGSQVIVMPDHNPWKEVREDSLWQEACDIWQALKGIKKDCESLKLSLFLGFLGLKQKNPTITWLRKVAMKEKWLLMGEDTFLSLHKWTHGDEVLQELTGLYVCPRAKPQEKVLAQRDHLIANYNKELRIEFLAPHAYELYSSTWLRQKAKKS